MDIRTAILKAASDIEASPGIFNYWNTNVPPCGSPGCAIGLIAANLDFQRGLWVGENCERILGVDSHTFYRRMGDAADSIDISKCWIEVPLLAAKTLRSYAYKYHPAEKPVIPEAVRAIFDMTPAQADQAIDQEQEAFEKQQDSEYDRATWDEIAASDAGIRIRGEI